MKQTLSGVLFATVISLFSLQSCQKESLTDSAKTTAVPTEPKVASATGFNINGNYYSFDQAESQKVFEAFKQTNPNYVQVYEDLTPKDDKQELTLSLYQDVPQYVAQLKQTGKASTQTLAKMERFEDLKAQSVRQNQSQETFSTQVEALTPQNTSLESRAWTGNGFYEHWYYNNYNVGSKLSFGSWYSLGSFWNDRISSISYDNNSGDYRILVCYEDAYYNYNAGSGNKGILIFAVPNGSYLRCTDLSKLNTSVTTNGYYFYTRGFNWNDRISSTYLY
ncbi:MAG: hypothetical protein RL329_1114 [Bacteroidota bacterium]|jgi:hypothetical protein